jgi:Tfp pilus assembly protein PilF
MKMPFRKAVAQTEYGKWLLQQGRLAEAEDLLTQAVATFAELGATPWLEHVGASRRRPAQPEAATAMPA